MELARSRAAAQGEVADPLAPFPSSGAREEADFHEATMNKARLESKRIVAHDPVGAGGRYYDMLRTQVLQAMDHNGWHILAITSPTAGCGKTLTACNLAMSIARLPERSVLLVDMDLHKPSIANYLGLDVRRGLLSVLRGDASLSGAIVRASIADNRLLVLPGEDRKSVV